MSVTVREQHVVWRTEAEVMLVAELRALPSPGDLLDVDGTFYKVRLVNWSLSGSRLTAVVRLKKQR